MAKRVARKETKNIDYLKPIDISYFGTEDDPCFGKLYNPSAPECQRCGDADLCSVIFAQNIKKDRQKESKKTKFKDIEMDNEEHETVRVWMKAKVKEGLKRSEIIKEAKKLFGLDRTEIKRIYKNV